MIGSTGLFGSMSCEVISFISMTIDSARSRITGWELHANDRVLFFRIIVFSRCSSGSNAAALHPQVMKRPRK